MSAQDIARHVGPAAQFLNIPHGLTELQKAFADHWLLTRNGTQSAGLAGYAGNDAQLAVQASDNLKLPKIQAYLNQTLKLHLMSSDEVLKRLSKQARASIADVLTDEGEFDLDYAKSQGSDDLIRKLKIRKRIIPVRDGESETEITHELELHNSQTALELMAKHHGLLGEQKPEGTTVNIEKVELTVVLQNALADVIDVTPE
jgi:phage terminase small subunit